MNCNVNFKALYGVREVGAGKCLANLVRSGRKQPQRAPLGSMSSLSPTQTPYLEDYHDYFLDPLGRDALKSFHFPRRFAAAHDACQVIKLAREI